MSSAIIDQFAQRIRAIICSKSACVEHYRWTGREGIQGRL